MQIGLSCFPRSWDWGVQSCAACLELEAAALPRRPRCSSELCPGSVSQPSYQLRPAREAEAVLPVWLTPGLSQIAGTICASPI